MIVDIENRGEYLKVSHFTEEGDLAFLDVPIPEEERFVYQMSMKILDEGQVSFCFDVFLI